MTCPDTVNAPTILTATVLFIEDGIARAAHRTGNETEVSRHVRQMREDAPRHGIEIVEVVTIPATAPERERYLARARRYQAGVSTEAA